MHKYSELGNVTIPNFAVKTKSKKKIGSDNFLVYFDCSIAKFIPFVSNNYDSDYIENDIFIVIQYY
jgi:hypothetical protein